MSEPSKPDIILLAEDDSDDRLLLKDAVADCGWSGELHCVEDGEELLDYLLRRGKYQSPGSAPHPGVILLDLNMPRKDGRQALREIRADASLHRLDINLVFASPCEENDRRLAAPFQGRAQEIHSGLRPQPVIYQADIMLVAQQRIQARLEGLLPIQRERVAMYFGEQITRDDIIILIIFDQQNFGQSREH